MENIFEKLVAHFKTLEHSGKTKNGVRSYVSSSDFSANKIEQGFCSLSTDDVDVTISHGEVYRVEIKNHYEVGKIFRLGDYIDAMIKAYNDSDYEIEDTSSFWSGAGDIITKTVEVEKEVASPVNEYYRGKSEVLDELLSRDVIELKK